MVKKILIFLMAIMLNFGAMNAQVEPARFFDNTSLVVKGGASTPLNDFGTIDYGQVGVEVEKGITPWLAFALDGNFYLGADKWNVHENFDKLNVNALAKFNVLNLFGTFKGERRVFELVPFTGVGWGHYTYEAWPRNYMTYKAGADFDFNLGSAKAWAIRLQPAVVWACPDAGRLNKNNADFELNVGVVYHFKNHDCNRTFTLVRPYDYDEVNELNATVNSLREANCLAMAENAELKNALNSMPTTQTVTVVETKVETIPLMPRTQFYVNSARLIPEVEANVMEMAEYMKANPNKTWTLTGYASVEGDPEYNKVLSERRANTLRDKLIGYGVNGDHLLAKGAGATEKFSDNRTMNRVVIVEENR